MFQKTYTVSEKGAYKLSFDYIRKGVNKVDNTVTIHSISIVGSDLGGGSSCLTCPKGQYKPNNSTLNMCMNCGKGMTSNEDCNKIILIRSY